jgi:hypothetical protein
MIRALGHIFRAFGQAFDRAHLRWARAHLSKHNPLHPDLPAIVRRLRQLEDRRG